VDESAVPVEAAALSVTSIASLRSPASGSPSDSLSRVLRVSAAGKRYYVKCYSGNGKSPLRRWFGLRRWLGPPRVRAEWQNLLAFRAWGIPTATLVAYGLERRFGGFVRGALVTEEIPDTLDLAGMATADDPRLRDRRWVDAGVPAGRRASRARCTRHASRTTISSGATCWSPAATNRRFT
jgi:hypothetical protein